MTSRFYRLALMLMMGLATGHGADHPAVVFSESKDIPVAEIRDYLSPLDWESVRLKKLDRIVAFKGYIRSDTSVGLRRATFAYPDSQWNENARKFASKVTLNASPIVGSFLEPGAEIFVISFEANSPGSTVVLVYAQEIGYLYTAFGSEKVNGRHKLDNAKVGTSRRPKYLQTFVYETQK